MKNYNVVLVNVWFRTTCVSVVFVSWSLNVYVDYRQWKLRRSVICAWCEDLQANIDEERYLVTILLNTIQRRCGAWECGNCPHQMPRQHVPKRPSQQPTLYIYVYNQAQTSRLYANMRKVLFLSLLFLSRNSKLEILAYSLNPWKHLIEKQ